MRGKPGRTHGIRATYNSGCHCPPCCEANKNHCRRQRERRARGEGRTWEQYLADLPAQKDWTTYEVPVPNPDALTRTEVMTARA